MKTVRRQPAPTATPPTPPTSPTHRAATEREHAERIGRAVAHLETRLDWDLSLAELARKAHMSPFHFQRAFTRMVGSSPAAYVRRLRLELGARLLLRGESVGAAARACGFPHHEVFTRAYRAHFGRLPRVDARPAGDSEPLTPPREVRVWVNRTSRTRLRFVAEPPTAAQRVRPDRLFRVEALGPLRVASIRCVGGTPSLPEAFARLLRWVAAKEGGPLEPACFALVHDEPTVTPPELRRIDACVTVSRTRRSEGPIRVRTVPLTTYAVTTAEGTLASTAGVRSWLERACGATGRRTRLVPGLEFYLSLPAEPGDVAAALKRGLIDVMAPIDLAAPAMRPYFRRHRPYTP